MRGIGWGDGNEVWSLLLNMNRQEPQRLERTRTALAVVDLQEKLLPAIF